MRLDNTLFDIDTLLSELDKEIPGSESAHKAQPNALEILQRKIKDNYFQDNTRPKDKKMKPEEVLNHLNSPAFLDFPRLKYVIHEIFKGNQNIQIPEELKDWEPTVSFKSLNEKYGYFDTDLNDLFTRLAIACRKMTAIIERQAHDDEMAYKLMALFYDPNKTSDENFKQISEKFDALITKNQDQFIETPYHDAFVTILSPFPIFEQVKNFASWQSFIAKEGFKALKIFAQCAKLQPAFENMQKAQEFLITISYPRANEHPILAKLCKSMLISNDGFEAGLEHVKTGWPKKETDHLPIVDIADDNNEYCWVKLPPQDMRAMYLGNLIPGCCQFINGHSRQCVKDGIQLSDNGFYVLLKAEKGKSNEPHIINGEINDKHFSIVAQSYAWISNNGNLCLDSIEWNPARVTTLKIEELMSKFSQKVFQEHPTIKHITVGKGGQTPRAMYPSCHINEMMKQGHMYGDSQQQYTIASNISKDELATLKECLKTYPQDFQKSMMYWAPYFRDIPELLEALRNGNPNIPIEFPQQINRVNLPLTFSVHDFKKISFEDYQKMDTSEQSKISTVCKIFNSHNENELNCWLPTISVEELSYISLLKNDYSPEFIMNVMGLLSPVQRLSFLDAFCLNNQAKFINILMNPALLKRFIELFPLEECLKIFKEKDILGLPFIFHAALNPESLKLILELYRPEEQLQFLQKKDMSGCSLLFYMTSNPQLLKWILELYPPEECRQALKEKDSFGSSVLFNAASNLESLKILLDHYSPEEGFEMVKAKNNYGGTLLFCVADDAPTLKMILELYPIEERFDAIKEKDILGTSILANVLSNFESFKVIFDLLPAEHRLEVVKEKDRLGHSLLFQATLNPKVLEMFLQCYTPEERLQAIKEKDNYGKPLLFYIASNPESLKMLMDLLPAEQHLNVVMEKDAQGHFLLSRAAADPKCLQIILEYLPKDIALVITSREKELETNCNNVLESAWSLEKFMKDMQGLAKPEAVNDFFHALIENKEIESARNSLFAPNSCFSFFKQNNNAAIQKCIDKLDTYWLARINPELQKPSQKKP